MALDMGKRLVGLAWAPVIVAAAFTVLDLLMTRGTPKRAGADPLLAAETAGIVFGLYAGLVYRRAAGFWAAGAAAALLLVYAAQRM